MRVVFPAPGGASTTRFGVRCRDARISGRIASTGSAGFRLTGLIGTRSFGRRQCTLVEAGAGALEPFQRVVSGS